MIFNKDIKQLPASRQIGLRLAKTLKNLEFISFILLVFSGLSPLTPPLSNAAVDKYSDLAIGVPFEHFGAIADAGGVGVLYGNSSGLSATGRFDDQFWSKDEPGIDGTAAAGERFGTSLTTGDFNGDGHLDLAIGVPYETIGGAANAGSVQVIYGGPMGLSSGGSQNWNENSPGLGSLVENGDFFGFALAAGDFNHDGFCDLAIGISGKNVGTGASAGAVQILYGSATGLTATGAQIWHQSVAGMLGAAEADDRFGFSLAAGDFNGDGFVDLAVGVPFEDVGVVVDAGAAHIIYGSASGLNASGNQLWVQEDLTLTSETSDFFGWALTAGDFNGDGKMDLAVGAQGEDIGGLNGGAVTVIYGTGSGLSAAGRNFWHQGIAGILGDPLNDDNFGWALTAGDFNGDGFSDLAIGVPHDNESGVVGSGAVNVIYGSAAGLATPNNQIWHQNLLDGSIAELNDSFGSALAAGDFNGDGYADLAVGVPLEDIGGVVDAGAVHVIFGSATGLTATGNQFIRQNLSGVRGVPETGDRFGSALAAGTFGKPEGLIFLPLVLSN